MPADGFFIHYLKNELKEKLVGCRVEKIHQPSKNELTLHLRSRGGAYKLFLSASSDSPRAHITQYAPENPANPPMLCMLFRKHLTSALITDVRQAGLDRILFIDFDATNEIGDRVKLCLSLERMHKHSNIILLSQNKIIDAVKRIDLTQSSYRQILPGLNYVLPPEQDKVNLLTDTADAVMERLFFVSQKPLSSALLSSLQGASPLVCRELSSLVSSDDPIFADLSDSQKARLQTLLCDLKSSLENNAGQPFMLCDNNKKPTDFSFIDITQYGFARTPVRFDSFSELLDNFYFERDRLDRTRQRAADMLKALTNTSSRIARKLVSQRQELLQCADRETLRINAELINAYLGMLQKGAPFYDVQNYYDECKIIRIPADPALSPAANAQKYYKAYRKAKTAEQMLQKLIEEGEQELQYVDTLLDLVSRSDSSAELTELRAEIVAAGYLKHKGPKSQIKSNKPLPFIEYTSTDGFKISVGRNNIQNDRLSLKTARGNDLWLHTQKIPGSHVVITSDGKEIPPTTIEQAAMIAAYHSKARESSQVPVDYTLAKHLKKPVGAKPGKVIYHVYNTLIITPHKDEVEKLRV